jgi:hypothetical protein
MGASNRGRVWFALDSDPLKIVTVDYIQKFKKAPVV